MDIQPSFKMRALPAAIMFTLATFSTAELYAQSDDIEHILVLGRANSDAINMAANVNIISSSDIQLSGANNLVDLLRGRFGIQISDNNTNATISMRGFTSGQAANNTLILVDGRKLNNIDIAAPALSSIPLNLIERVEVLSGSAGVLYGDQAVGGVINIITRNPNKTGGTIKISGGSFNTGEAQADVSGQFNQNWHYYLSGSQKNSDNYREHNASKTGAILAGIGYQDEFNQFYFESSYFDNYVETPGALTLAQFEANPRQSNPVNKDDYQHDMTTAFRAGGSHQLQQNWQLIADVNYRDSLVTSTNWGRSGRNNRDLLEFSPKAIGTYITDVGELNLVVGADVSQGNSKFDWSKSYYEPQEGKKAPLYRSNEQILISTYVQAHVPLTKEFSYVVGGRYSKVRDDLTENGVRKESNVLNNYDFSANLDNSATAFELGANYQLTEKQKLYARIEDNFRFAKVDEQAYTSPGVVGLKPQTGRSYEAGWQLTESFLQSRINVYRLDLEDEIIFDSSAPTPDGGGFTGANVNADASTRYGATISADWMIISQLQIGAEYNYIDAEFTEGANKGKSLSWVAKQNARVYSSWDISNHWQLYSDVSYTGKRFLEGDNANLGDKLDPYALWNLAINYDYQNWLASLRVDNLLDEQYVSYSVYNGSPLYDGYYSGTGRSIRLTLSHTF